MASVTIINVLDEGMAALLVEELDRRGIEAEVVPVANVYHVGRKALPGFDVRVEADREREALAALEQIAEESPRASEVDWDGAAPPAGFRDDGSDDPDAAEAADPPPKMWMAVPLSLLIPLPLGVLYGRARALCYALVGLFAGGLVLGVATGNPRAGLLTLGAKGLDVALTPLVVGLANRGTPGGRDWLRFGAALTLALSLGLGALGWVGYSEVVRREQTKAMFRDFSRAAKLLAAGQDAVDEKGRPFVFAATPIGRLLTAALDFARRQPARSGRVLDGFERERAAWAAQPAPSGPPGESWYAERLAGADALDRAIAEAEQGIAAERAFLDELGTYDEDTQAFAEAMRAQLDGAPARKGAELRAALAHVAALWRQEARKLGAGEPPANLADLDAERVRVTDDAALAVRLLDRN